MAQSAAGSSSNTEHPTRRLFDSSSALFHLAVDEKAVVFVCLEKVPPTTAGRTSKVSRFHRVHSNSSSNHNSPARPRPRLPGRRISGLALNAAVGTTLLQLIWHLVEEEVDIELVEMPPMGIILEQEDDGGNDTEWVADEAHLSEYQLALAFRMRWVWNEDVAIINQRVNTHAGVSTMNLFVCIPKTPKRIETFKSELGLEMVKPNVSSCSASPRSWTWVCCGTCSI
ncbi:monocarboxylate transporter [Culex quinquefasciatus]|uniref:Monocarboxylate transporter n=1 Tax=Culex quinquefasciatus TaxID=7176 RepID=B0W2C8_CULQU|nr:monocarboxylate transporter [Culex quinquefasciatus]|eukprot:XP_001842831.1 monocarboxylate transporter [Culex quinquefasciatus]